MVRDAHPTRLLRGYAAIGPVMAINQKSEDLFKAGCELTPGGVNSCHVGCAPRPILA